MIQTRLFLMMLLQLAIWGAYMPKLFPYMGQLGFEAWQQSLVGSAWGIASILAGVLLGGGILWAGVVVPQQRTLAQMQTELASLKTAIRTTPTSETTTTITTLRKELSQANQKYEALTQVILRPGRTQRARTGTHHSRRLVGEWLLGGA